MTECQGCHPLNKKIIGLAKQKYQVSTAVIIWLVNFLSLRNTLQSREKFKFLRSLTRLLQKYVYAYMYIFVMESLKYHIPYTNFMCFFYFYFKPIFISYSWVTRQNHYLHVNFRMLFQSCP